MMAPDSSGSGVFSFGVLGVPAVNAVVSPRAAGGHVGTSVLERYMAGRLGGTDGVAEALVALVGATVSTEMQVGPSQVPNTKMSPLARGLVLDVATLVGRLRTSYLVLRVIAVDSALHQLLILELVS